MTQKQEIKRIAIDGGAATGKTTIAFELAKKLNFNHINTGSMYRLITLYAIKHNLLKNEKQLLKEIMNETFTYLNNHLVSSIDYKEEELTTVEIDEQVNLIANSPLLREYITKCQQELIADRQNIVVEGRDIGTIIMPDANLKFFLTVSSKQATKRRFQQLKNPEASDYLVIFNNIKERNDLDTNRPIAPLRPVNDSIIINTDFLTQKQVLQKMLSYIKN